MDPDHEPVTHEQYAAAARWLERTVQLYLGLADPPPRIIVSPLAWALQEEPEPLSANAQRVVRALAHCHALANELDWFEDLDLGETSDADCSVDGSGP